MNWVKLEDVYYNINYISQFWYNDDINRLILFMGDDKISIEDVNRIYYNKLCQAIGANNEQE